MKKSSVITNIKEIETQISFYNKIKEALVFAEELLKSKSWNSEHERVLLLYINIQHIQETVERLREIPMLVKSVKGERYFNKNDFTELMRNKEDWDARKELVDFAEAIHMNNSPYTARGRKNNERMYDTSVALLLLKNGNGL